MQIEVVKHRNVDTFRIRKHRCHKAQIQTMQYILAPDDCRYHDAYTQVHLPYDCRYHEMLCQRGEGEASEVCRRRWLKAFKTPPFDSAHGSLAPAHGPQEAQAARSVSLWADTSYTAVPVAVVGYHRARRSRPYASRYLDRSVAPRGNRALWV